MSSIDAFMSVCTEFVSELVQTFPEEKRFALWNQLLSEREASVVFDVFMEHAVKLSDAITTRNISLISDMKICHFDGLDLQFLMNSASASTQDIIWQYTNTLFVLGTTIKSIPKNMLSTIEQFAESCSQSAENPIDMKSMGDMLNGIMNMVGTKHQKSSTPPNENKKIGGKKKRRNNKVTV